MPPPAWEDDPDFPSDERLVYGRGGGIEISETQGNLRRDLDPAPHPPGPGEPWDPYWENPGSNPNFLANPESRILVIPERKLAFCYIEKNACTQFNLLFNRLNGNAEVGKSIWFRSTAGSFNLSRHELRAENGWKWGVFLRNPELRYLSSWGSKCLQQDGDPPGKDCVPRPAVSSPGLKEKKKVRGVESHVLLNSEDPAPMALNPHWAPQHTFCGGLFNLTGFDFVGHMHGDVNGQVTRLLRTAPHLTWRSRLNAHGNDEDLVDLYFPRAGGPVRGPLPGHGSVTGREQRKESSLDPAEYYRSEEIRRRVEKMYAKDYELPGLEYGKA